MLRSNLCDFILPLLFTELRSCPLSREKITVKAIIEPTKKAVRIIVIRQNLLETRVSATQSPVSCQLVEHRLVQCCTAIRIRTLKQELHKNGSAKQIVCRFVPHPLFMK